MLASIWILKYRTWGLFPTEDKWVLEIHFLPLNSQKHGALSPKSLYFEKKIFGQEENLGELLPPTPPCPPATSPLFCIMLCF